VERFRSSFLPAAPKAAVEAADVPVEPVVRPAAAVPGMPIKDVPHFIATQPKTASRINLEDRLRQAESRFQSGKKLYQSGDFLGARAEFDLAVDTLLSAPESLPERHLVEKKLDELTDRIHRLDVEGLGAGDAQENAIFERSPLQEILELTFPINPGIKNKVSEQVRATASQLPLDTNDTVLRYINYFTSSERGRATLINGLKRSGRYQEMISRILAEEGVPQELIFLAQAESAFQARAVSYKAAAGMWQFVQWRGNEYGLKQTALTDERLDPEKATRAGARHLRDLYKQFGDWYLAMAAYNCGPGCVSRAVERTGYADFWELRNRNVLPQETANYVPLILALTIVAKNPREYGIEDVERDAPLEFDSVEITANTSTQLVAGLADVSNARLKELNPSLLGATIPAGHVLKVPPEVKETLQAGLLMIPPDKRASWRTHRVADGENAADIARRYGTAVANVAPVNRASMDEVRAGDVVIIQAAYVPKPVVKRTTTRKYTARARTAAKKPAAKVASNARSRTASAAVRKPATPKRKVSGAYSAVNLRGRRVSAR
jgi:membrane-bound lytic murein transglycosylase D